MNILFLTNKSADNKEELVDFIKMYSDRVIVYYDRISLEYIAINKIDFIVSDRNSYIISSDVLVYMEGKIVNTHPSLLPLNRGWQPNFFSIYNDTKKGVSIHVVDPGLDTGDILLQKEIFFNDDDTLRTAHYILRKALVNLFCEGWRDLLNCHIVPEKQGKVGSINYKKEFDSIFPSYENGWDTKVKHVRGGGLVLS